MVGCLNSISLVSYGFPELSSFAGSFQFRSIEHSRSSLELVSKI